MACALREEGFRARHVEKDHDACETLRAAGFGDVFEGAVECLDEWRPEADAMLLHGSPPCPVWSSVTHPSRRELAYDGWPSMRDIVEALRTPLVTVENVGESPSVLWEHDLRRMGYHVASWVLDAANYGAPQRRVRRWIVASLDGLAAFPPPTHGEGLFGLRPLRTLREVLDPPGERVVYPRECGRAASEPWRLDEPAPTVTCQEVKGTRASAASKWSFNGGPDRASDATFLATGLRRISEAEAARLQGFPEGWPFRGTSESRYRQIGNAVEHRTARAVIRAARATLNQSARGCVTIAR